MIISNLSCQHIQVAPFSFEEAYNAHIVKALQITGTFNGNAPITKNINLSYGNAWTLTFESKIGVTATQVYAKNILTNQLFPLLSVPSVYAVSAVGLTALRNAIISAFHTLLNIDNLTVTATTLNGIVTISVSGLPYNIVMDKVVTYLLSIEKDVYFSFVASSDMIVGNNIIYLNPSFFGQTTFGDGIYHIETVVTTNDDTVITEQGCFFMDCTMSKSLQQLADTSECDTHKMHLLLMHYSLTQASNGICDCGTMYDIYKYLADNLIEYTKEDCGC